jgi:hypothetical protein
VQNSMNFQRGRKPRIAGLMPEQRDAWGVRQGGPPDMARMDGNRGVGGGIGGGRDNNRGVGADMMRGQGGPPPDTGKIRGDGMNSQGQLRGWRQEQAPPYQAPFTLEQLQQRNSNIPADVLARSMGGQQISQGGGLQGTPWAKAGGGVDWANRGTPYDQIGDKSGLTLDVGTYGSQDGFMGPDDLDANVIIEKMKAGEIPWPEGYDPRKAIRKGYL